VTGITSAHLRLHVAEGLVRRNQRYRIKVFVEIGTNKQSQCASTAARVADRWVQVEVGRCVDRWIGSDKHRYDVHSLDFIVQAKAIQSESESESVSVRFSSGGPSERRALLVLSKEDRNWQGIAHSKSDLSQTQSSRHRRQTKKRTGKSNERRQGKKNRLCRRHTMFVNFKEIGWDSIVAPEGYNAYRCQGLCPWPLNDKLNSSTHAVIQSTLRKIGSQPVPRVCCVPTKLSSISLLYFESRNTIVFRQQSEDMVVESCGCR
jgi:bone morphogenetic protein 2/4